MSRETVGDVWDDFRRLPIELHPVGPLAASAFDLAVQHHATAYDATYVALAISLDAQLLTSDAGLRQAFTETGRVQQVDNLRL